MAEELASRPIVTRFYIAVVEQDDDEDPHMSVEDPHKSVEDPHKSVADPRLYAVSFPDLPGCFSMGETLEEAHEMAKDALGLYLHSCAKFGEAAPESNVDAFLADPLNLGVPFFLVEIEVIPLKDMC